MKHKIAVFGMVGLLLCNIGCNKTIEESHLIGTWQFDVEHSIMALNTNHTFTIRGKKSDAGGMSFEWSLHGEWSFQGDQLITSGQTWADGSKAIVVSKRIDNKITKLTDTQMVWGSNSLTRVVSSH